DLQPMEVEKIKECGTWPELAINSSGREPVLEIAKEDRYYSIHHLLIFSITSHAMNDLNSHSCPITVPGFAQDLIQPVSMTITSAINPQPAIQTSLTIAGLGNCRRDKIQPVLISSCP